MNKTSTKKIMLIIAIVVVVVLAVIAAVFLLNPRLKKAKEAYINNDWALCRQQIVKMNSSEHAKIVEYLNEQLSVIVASFNKGTMTYDESLLALYNTSDLVKPIVLSNYQSSLNQIEDLQSSKLSFKTAKEYDDAGDSITAYEEYKKVISIDENYAEATQRIAVLEKEVEWQLAVDAATKSFDEAYKRFDVDAIEDALSKLEALEYNNISDLRKVFEYDKSVYPTVLAFYQALKDVKPKLDSGNPGSLNSMVSQFRPLCKDLEALQVNPNSKVGSYINQMRYVGNNQFYYLFRGFVNSDTDYDYYLTHNGYVVIMKKYVDTLLTTEFPFEIE